ncbi:DUF4293 domain-containing protein [Bacteroidales bacterium OttesenSCG-928-I21]|nr:DUF4293 domain-containing protein [Bacteroidales bacterium OttesenSCG-928-I21]
MIQRIQSLYLFLALACMLVLFFVPFGSIVINPEAKISLDVFGCNYLNKNGDTVHFSTFPTLIILIPSVLITFISIFMYKKRVLQIRFNSFNIILQLGTIGLMFLYLYFGSNKFGIDFETKFTILLPIAAAIFTFLAIRGIIQDEALVKSLNRIR